METKEKFKAFTKAELSKLSETELISYTKDIKFHLTRLKEETLNLRKQAISDCIKTAELQGELKVWKELNAREIKRLGWEDLTEDELNWVYKNFHTEWTGKYFKADPTVREIKERYAERMGKKVGDEMDKKFALDPKMEIENGWVDRSGTYFPVGLAEHDQWAWRYLTEKLGARKAGDEIMKTGTAHNYLEKVGWVRIMKWPRIDVEFILPAKLTHAQKQTVDKYCQIHKVSLPFEDPLF